MKKILFVCLGNICRSSTAEGVMLHLIKEAGLEEEFVIDSAGILSYHQGELPDSRMRAHAARRGYQLVHRSRPVRTEDFYNFDLIIGMDDRNIDDLKEKAPSTEEWKKIHRMTEYCTRIPADHVPDPYYGGAEGFEYVLDVLEDACAGLLTSLTLITDPCVISDFQLFFEYSLDGRNVLESDRALFEITFSNLGVNDLVDQVADSFFRIFWQTA